MIRWRSLLAAGLALVAGTADSAKATEAEVVACPFEVPPGVEATCHRVTRPLGSGASAALDVALFVLVIEGAAGGNEAPLVYLDGGPGGNAFLGVDDVGVWWQALEDYPFLGRRDLVILAQRGSPPSRPSIDCPPFKAAVEALLAEGLAARGGARDTRLDAIAGCAAALRDQGVPLGAFTTDQRAADMPAVLRALGYRSWHLWGVSYGTYLALTVLRDDPEGIRSIVLDSVMTPDVPDDLVDDEDDRWRRRLFALCAADPSCAARYPDLPAMFERVVAALDREPLTWTEDPDDVAAPTLVMDGRAVAEAIEVLTYDAAASRAVPAALADAEAGDFDRLAGIVGALVWYEREDGMASLALDARWCGEVRGFVDPAGARVSDIHDLKHDRVPDGEAWCASLGVASLGAAARAPAVSDVPVLLLVGEEDLVTPPAWAEAAAHHLSQATLIRFPGYGHAVTFATPCALEVVAAFLDDPVTAAASPCLGDLATPPFEMP